MGKEAEDGTTWFLCHSLVVCILRVSEGALYLT